MELLNRMNVQNRSLVIALFYGYMSLLSLLAAGIIVAGTYLCAPIALPLSTLGMYLADSPLQGVQLLGLAALLLLMLDLLAVILSRLHVAHQWVSLGWIVVVSSVVASLFSCSLPAIMCCYAIPAFSFGFCGLYAALTGQNLARWHNLVLFALVVIASYCIVITFAVPQNGTPIQWKVASKLSFDLIMRRKSLILPPLFHALETIFNYCIVPTIIAVLSIMLTAPTIKKLEYDLEVNRENKVGDLINQHAFTLFFKIYRFIRYPIVKLLFALGGHPINKPQ